MTPANSSAPVVVITPGGLPATLVINALCRRFDTVHVLIEDVESKGEILRRRARRLGWVRSIGQMATMAGSKFLRRLAAGRVADIVQSTGLSAELSSSAHIHRIDTINDQTCLTALARIEPAVVLLVSTRLLHKRTLSQIACPILNLHAGINPAYRGQMGGYWSLVHRDEGNFGATVHLVDAGTDTGATLYEARTVPAKNDTIATYPLLLTAAALPIAVQAVADAVSGHLKPIAASGPSALHFPPVIWAWFWRGITRRIW